MDVGNVRGDSVGWMGGGCQGGLRQPAVHVKGHGRATPATLSASLGLVLRFRSSVIAAAGLDLIVSLLGLDLDFAEAAVAVGIG